MEPEIVQRFLESVGAKADIDLYLKLHRAQRKESFAILAPNAQIVKTALDPVHFDLRILAGLGLVPVVVLGLLEPKDADAQASRVSDWLLEDAVACEVLRASVDAVGAFSPDSVAAVRAIVGRGAIPLVSLEACKDASTEGRFRVLASLAASLETRKVVFLSRRPGLAANGAAPLSVVSLATDTERLLASGGLSRGQAMLLRQIKQLIEAVPHRLSVTVVNPLQLLREFFTVNGAGTLIRRGSRIDVTKDWAGVDRARITALFESAFERRLRPEFFDQPVARVFVEDGYRGVAVMQETRVAPYLSKFAVERSAQGEGIGGELWSLVAREFPRFFWRSRAGNAITPWYAKQCDGFTRFPEWHVFWRGLEIETIDPAVRFALDAPNDFAS
jgi:NAT, N-acetyltransferase, of N-acetylglutamate synthase